MSLSSPLIAKTEMPYSLDERRGGVVLGRERVRGAEDHVGAAGLQRAHQVRRLGRDVQAGGDAVPGERLLGREALADRSEAPASATWRGRSAYARTSASADIGDVVV